MRRAARLLRATLSLALAVAAAACIVRGFGRLFFGGPPSANGGFDGIGAALGYFAAGLVLLLAAGELFPKPTPTPAPDRP